MPSSHKQRKHKERQRRLIKKRALPEGQGPEPQPDRYPTVTIADAEGAPAPLLQAVQFGLNTFHLHDVHKFSPVFRRFFWDQAHFGFHRARQSFVASAEKILKHTGAHVSDHWTQVLENQLYCVVGQALYDHVPEIQAFLPSVDLQVLTGGDGERRWDLYFQSMLSQPSALGRLYYSRHAPIVEVEGEARKLAWSKHAVEQVCGRGFGGNYTFVMGARSYESAADAYPMLKDYFYLEPKAPGWRTYGGLGDAYAFLNDYTYVEPIELTTRTPAVAVYLPCDEPSVTRHFVEQILGAEGVVKGKNYALLLGYLPLDRDGDFWKAKTLLLPGFNGTPERTLLSGLAREVRRQKKAEIDHLDRSELYLALDLSILRWFHENGKPQAKVVDRALFEGYVGSRPVDEVRHARRVRRLRAGMPGERFTSLQAAAPI